MGINIIKTPEGKYKVKIERSELGLKGDELMRKIFAPDIADPKLADKKVFDSMMGMVPMGTVSTGRPPIFNGSNADDMIAWGKKGIDKADKLNALYKNLVKKEQIITNSLVDNPNAIQRNALANINSAKEQLFRLMGL